MPKFPSLPFDISSRLSSCKKISWLADNWQNATQICGQVRRSVWQCADPGTSICKPFVQTGHFSLVSLSYVFMWRQPVWQGKRSSLWKAMRAKSAYASRQWIKMSRTTRVRKNCSNFHWDVCFKRKRAVSKFVKFDARNCDVSWSLVLIPVRN